MKTDDAIEVGKSLVHIAQDVSNPLAQVLLNTNKALIAHATPEDKHSIIVGVLIELSVLVSAGEKAQKYLIQKGMEEPFYLGAWNGDDEWEWDATKDTAWRISLDEAERMLKRVHAMFPDALLLEA